MCGGSFTKNTHFWFRLNEQHGCQGQFSRHSTFPSPVKLTATIWSWMMKVAFKQSATGPLGPLVCLFMSIFEINLESKKCETGPLTCRVISNLYWYILHHVKLNCYLFICVFPAESFRESCKPEKSCLAFIESREINNTHSPSIHPSGGLHCSEIGVDVKQGRLVSLNTDTPNRTQQTTKQQRKFPGPAGLLPRLVS